MIGPLVHLHSSSIRVQRVVPPIAQETLGRRQPTGKDVGELPQSAVIRPVQAYGGQNDQDEY
jgi:hypothetical protein